MRKKLLDQIQTPTLLLNKPLTRRNLQSMAEKARAHNLRFRPHFKTHQSAVIGEWFRQIGITAVTVSSVEMANYFIQSGWQDVLIAFPINKREIDKINELNQKVDLHLLVESLDSVDFLSENLGQPIHLWLELDAGYGRTGVQWQKIDQIIQIATAIKDSPMLHFAGILTHAGNTYLARTKSEIIDIHGETNQRLQQVKQTLEAVGIETAVSIGDTPSCRAADDFKGIDEIRPGNFIFHDLMQVQIGACSVDEISVALACPVVAVYPEKEQIAVYGGAVHLSKEQLILAAGRVSYGRVARLSNDGWQVMAADSFVKGLSQEHGILQASKELCHQVTRGDILLILPVHSCLTVNLHQKYLTLAGEWIKIGGAGK